MVQIKKNAMIARELKNELKPFRLGNVSDKLPDSTLKGIVGGVDDEDCWKILCLDGDPCVPPGSIGYTPCPGDYTATCYEPSSVCFDIFDASCAYGFNMWPCE